MIDKTLKVFNLIVFGIVVASSVLGLWYKFEPDPLQISDMFVNGKPYTKGNVIYVNRGDEVSFGGNVCHSKKFDVVVDRTFYLVEGYGADIRDGSILYPPPPNTPSCNQNSFTLTIPDRAVIGNTYDYYPAMSYPINIIRDGNKEGFGFTFKVIE